MRAKVVSALLLLLLVSACHLQAQEPSPARLRASQVEHESSVALTLAWRYAPGDGAGREAPDLDDSRWQSLSPVMASGGLPKGWPGTGWFRRHILVDPSLQQSTIALRLATPGAADVYLDGQLVLRTGQAPRPAELPFPRRDSILVTFDGHRHLLAVRYAFPAGARVPESGAGFVLSVARPEAPADPEEAPSWLTGLRGALVALPALLAFLHLSLFWFEPRARENLFYSAEMAAFTLIVLREYRNDLLPTEAQREALGFLGQGVAILAILFGLLTYYAVRTNPFPRAWRAFVVATPILLAIAYSWPSLADYIWIPWFAAMVIEVFRTERSGKTVERRGSRVFMASLSVFGMTIILQALVVTGVLESVAGTRAVYVFGIAASAAGMSFYLAQTFGQARLVAAENERKGRELAQARELQLSMLPRVLPRVPGLEIATASHTAAEVGGDFYDVRPDGDGALLVAFGDATGHGMAAGILVTAAKALFASLPDGRPLSEMLAHCGRVLSAMNLPRLKMCLSLARVLPRSVTLVSAAMPPVLVFRSATGDVEELGTGGLPLGSRLSGRYEESRAGLVPGDVLLFASDGFAELRTSSEGELGYDGASAFFRQAAAAGGAREIVERLGRALAESRGQHPLEDDVTFLVVRVEAPESGPARDRPDSR